MDIIEKYAEINFKVLSDLIKDNRQKIDQT